MPDVIDYQEDEEYYSVNYNAALSKVIGALLKKIKELENKYEINK